MAKDLFAAPEAELRRRALAYPGAVEEFPWGDRVVKVARKIFVFLGRSGGEEFGISVKLPFTAEAALMFPFCTPTGYGLGKAGWVSATFTRGETVPVQLLAAWIDESYRAVAPKKLVKSLGPGLPGVTAAAPRKAAANARARRGPAARTPRKSVAKPEAPARASAKSTPSRSR